MKKLISVFALMICMLSTSGLAAEAPPPANTVCPVMEGNEIDKKLFVDYKGKRVYFCCQFCVTQFQKNPKQYESKIPAFSEIKPTSDATADSNDGHDHSAHSGGVGDKLGKLHPVIVHFPIALVLVAALAELLFLLTKKRLFREHARFALLLGTIATIPAVGAGLLAAHGAGYTGDLADVLLKHRNLGFVSLGISVVSYVLQCFANKKGKTGLTIAYRAFLVASAVLIAVTGHFGGMLVYGINHFQF